MQAVDRHVADNEIERNHKKVMEIVRAAGPGGLTKSELTLRTQFIDRRTRDESLLTLTEAGFVTSRMRPSATRPTAVLVAIEADTAYILQATEDLSSGAFSSSLCLAREKSNFSIFHAGTHTHPCSSQPGGTMLKD